MKGIRFAEHAKIVPILAPIDTATSAVATAYVDLKYVQHASLLVNFGNMTSDSTDTTAITLEASTAASSNATELTVAYQYRVSEAVATDSWGAITNATTDGFSLAASSDDSKAVIIEVDPAAIANLGADYRFIRLVITPSAGSAITLVAANAFLEPRYAGNSMPSSS